MGWTNWHFEDLWWQINDMHFFQDHPAWDIISASHCGTLSGSFTVWVPLWGSETAAAALGSARGWKCVNLFLMVVMQSSWSKRRLLLLHPLLHTEVREEEPYFSLCRLNRIWRESRFFLNRKIWKPGNLDVMRLPIWQWVAVGRAVNGVGLHVTHWGAFHICEHMTPQHYLLPEPWVVFRVSVRPKRALMVAGEVYLARNTLVGPISSLQWRMASSLART